MKIFIPVTDSIKKRYKIASGVNESGTVCIFNSDDNQLTWYEAKDNNSSFPDMLADLKSANITDIIINKVFPLALKILTNNGFTVYKSVGDDLITNLELFKMKCLPIYQMEEALTEHSSCSRTCTSCASSELCQN